MKHCPKCDTVRPTSEFSKDRSRADGLQVYCDGCLREYRREHRARLRESTKRWKAAHPDQVRENNRRSRARPSVRERRTEYNRAWKEANPDKVREQSRRSYERHAEERRKAARIARIKDPESHRERCRRWRASNKDRVAAYRRDHREQDRDYYARNADVIREKKESRRQWCVYRITFVDGCFYVGSSCHHDLRSNAHRSLSARGRNVSALNGRDFTSATVEVLFDCSDEPDALEKEAAAIRSSMSDHPEKCLNSTIPATQTRDYWVYVIQSQAPRSDSRGRPKPGFFYVGMTTDPSRRLREHNGLYADGSHGNPNGGKYTSKHRPWQARALYGPYATRSDALRAEYALKRQKRGEGRLRWTPEDSPWCRGEGPRHPWVGDPVAWKPMK